MAINKTRILLSFYLLSNQEGPMCSYELASKVGVTERTIKNDIKDLKQFAQASGAELCSKKGAGYFLIIKDRNLFDPVKDQLTYYFQYVGENVHLLKSRVNDILRRLIIEDKFLTVDDIAEELYLTRSSIRKEMREVNTLLEQFSLRFKQKNEEGPLILGSELNRRLLMICIFESHYHKAVTLYNGEEYLSWFNLDEQERYDIRHIFLHVLRESECHIRDTHTQRLARYICLMKNRYLAGHAISFTKEQKKYIMQFKQAHVAKRIFEELHAYNGFTVSEDEVLGFGLLLLCWADINPNCDLKANYCLKYEEAAEIVDSFAYSLKEDYGFDILSIASSKQILMKGFIPLLIQKDFGILSQPIKNQTQGFEMMPNGALPLRMAYNVTTLFSQRYNIFPSDDNILLIAISLSSIFHEIKYPYKKLRAIVGSSNGLYPSLTLKQAIQNIYGAYFERLDTCELYEMRSLKTEDYDYAILGYPDFSYRYDWPLFRINQVPTQKDLIDLYYQVIVNGVQLQEAFDILQLDMINLYKDFDYQDMESFIKLISFKSGKNSSTIERIESSLLFTKDTSIINKTVILFIKEKYCHGHFMDIYQLAQTKRYADNDIQYILVMSTHFQNSLEATRFVNDLTYMFGYHPEHFIESIAYGQTKNLVEIVRASLTELPISLL